MENILAQSTIIREEFSWLHEPERWSLEDGVLTIVPEPLTDFFRPPSGQAKDNACLLSRPVEGDFTAVAHLSAELVGFGDAGAVTVRSSPEKWAKLCLERSPIGEVNAVSVVTDGSSDDANGELLKGPEGWLRITRRGALIGMHHSSDGARWRFVRAFALDAPRLVHVGIHAQAPFVGGCRVVFDFFGISDTAVQDFRSGE